MLRSFSTRYASTKLLSRLSSTASSNQDAYAFPVQILHWTMGGCIIGCVATFQAAQNTKGETKGQMMFLHKSCGLLALGLLGPRIFFRLASKTPPPLQGAAWEQFLGKATHIALYGLLTFLPISGAVMGYYSGKGLPFFFTTLEGAEKADGSIAKPAYTYHKQAGNILQYMVPFHIAGAAVHVIKGQTIFARILPFWK